MSDMHPVRQAVMAALAAQLPGIPERDLARFAQALTQDEPYAAVPVDATVPAGQLLERRHRSLHAYPGVERRYVVYVPQQIDHAHGAGLMVFQDGARYLGPEAHTAAVLDQLIARGEIPVMVAVFIEPGEKGPGLPIYGGSDNRSVEYDAQGDRYVRFLLDELLPEATAGLNVAAWERPDAFSKVMSHCGSFVDIRGGNACIDRVRRDDVRRLRVYLQSGAHDLDIVFGNWLLANRAMASALDYRGYDHCLVVGEGGHSLRHGGAVLADALRWLWRP